MGYFSLTKKESEELLEEIKSENWDIYAEKFEKIKHQHSQIEFDEGCVNDLMNQLTELPGEKNSEGRLLKGMYFDRRAAVLVHKVLNLSPAIAGDIGFWRWLTFRGDAESLDGVLIVDHRYPNKNHDMGFANKSHYGVTSQKKDIYFNFLWLRANAAFDKCAANPYHLQEIGDVDVWDSHIVGVNLGSIPNFARAFLKVVDKLKIERGMDDKKARARGLPPEIGYRKLASMITHKQASSALELFSEPEAIEFIEELWNSRDKWKKILHPSEWN